MSDSEYAGPSGSDSFDPTLWRERVHVQDARIEDNEVWIRLSAANAPRHTLPMALFSAGQTLVIEIKHDPLGVHHQNARPHAEARSADSVQADVRQGGDK